MWVKLFFVRRASALTWNQLIITAKGRIQDLAQEGGGEARFKIQNYHAKPPTLRGSFAPSPKYD